jgi:hypothetical protein
MDPAFDLLWGARAERDDVACGELLTPAVHDRHDAARCGRQAGHYPFSDHGGRLPDGTPVTWRGDGGVMTVVTIDGRTIAS